MLSVAVVGTGYVGLVTGVCLAELGHAVICVDTDADKITRLKAGDIPIYEPGLEQLVAANAGRSRLAFTTDIEAAAQRRPDVAFIAVGTPTEDNGGGASLAHVRTAVEQTARALT